MVIMILIPILVNSFRLVFVRIRATKKKGIIPKNPSIVENKCVPIKRLIPTASTIGEKRALRSWVTAIASVNSNGRRAAPQPVIA